MAQADTLTLTTLLLDVRSRLLDALQSPPTDHNRTELTSLWRVCLTVHDLAESHHDARYVSLMEQMIDAVADYNGISQPETVDWQDRIPSAEAIKAVA